MQNLKRILENSQIIICCLLFIISIFFVGSISDRAIWVDEAVLLKNITEINDWFDLFFYLPFYDQSQPSAVSIAQKIILTYISKDVETFRLVLFLLLTAMSAPIIFLFKSEKVSIIWPTLAFMPLLYNFGIYYTEIKHYGFETASVFLLILIFYLFLNKYISFQSSLFSMAMLSILGFSTLLLVGVLTVFIFYMEVRFNSRRILIKQNIIPMILVTTFIIIIFCHMKYLTQYQIGQNAVYDKKNLLESSRELYGLIQSTFGRGYLILCTLAITHIVLLGRNVFLKRLAHVFIALLFFILILKVLNFYPVIYIRHIIWIMPIGYVILALYLSDLIREKNNVGKTVLAVLFTLHLLFTSGELTAKVITKRLTYNLTENKKLINHLESMQATTILVFLDTKPTIEYYLQFNNELKKHNFIMISDERVRSGIKTKFSDFQRFKYDIDTIFENVNSSKYYYIQTRMQKLFTDEQSKHPKAFYLEKKFEEKSCTAAEVLSGKFMQILKIDCETIKKKSS